MSLSLAVAAVIISGPACDLARPRWVALAQSGVIGAAIGATDAPVLGLSVEVDRAALAMAAASRGDGAPMLRVRLDWAAIERDPGEFDWADWDQTAVQLRPYGRRVLAAVDTAPAWARRDPPWPEAWWVPCEAEAQSWPEAMPPTDPANLARFLGVFTARYRDVLVGIEVWREPNVVPHWRRTGPDPEEYAAVLVAASRAVRDSAPEVRVISAGLTPTTDVGPCFLSDYVYLDRLARTGALQAVDAVGVEISGFERPADDPAVDREVLNVRRAELLHRVLVRHGVDRPIWIVAALRGDDAAGRTGDGGAGAGEAADVATLDAAWFEAVWDIARADWPWLGALFVGNFGAPSQRPTTPAPPPMSLRTADGAPTLLSMAVRRASADAAPVPAPVARAAGATVDPSEPPTSGSARIVRPWPERPVRSSLLLVLGLGIGAAATATAAWALRRPTLRSAARRIEAAIRPWTARPPWFGRCVLVALVLADGVAGWPLNAPLVPAMVVAAAVWPLAAIWMVAAATPFYFAAYALHLAPALGPRAIGPVELLIAVALAGAGARWVLDRAAGTAADPSAPGRGRRPSLHPLDVGALLLVAWSALTPLWAEEPSLALREWRTVIAEPAAFYALLRLWPDRRAAAVTAWHGVVAGASIAALWGLVGVAGHALGWGVGAVAAEGVVRAQGPYNSPNNLALILGRVCLGLASGWVFAHGVRVSGSDGWPETTTGDTTPAGVRRRDAGLSRASLLGWAAMAVCTAALLATFSRGTILVGLPASALWLGVLAARGRMGRRAVGWVAAGVLGVALLLLPFAGTARVGRALDLRPGSTLYYRVRLWESAVQMGLDHPVLGVGLDNFMGLFRDRYVQRDVIQERFLSHPHNIALDWWTRLGLPGFVLLAAWLVWFARTAARVVIAGPSEDRACAAVGLGALVYGLAHGLLDNSFFLVDLAVYTWVAQALVLAAGEQGRGEERPSEATRVGPPGFEPGTNRL